MDDHISPQRLAELAKEKSIVELPEWSHIKQCDRCAKAFVRFLEEVTREPNA
jgi:hypothetical protein